jgi:hypothetical protein
VDSGRRFIGGVLADYRDVTYPASQLALGRWFGFLTDQLLRRGAHTSVVALENDVRAWIANWNEDPKPFVWKKTAEEILNSLAKYRTVLRRRTLEPADRHFVSGPLDSRVH